MSVCSVLFILLIYFKHKQRGINLQVTHYEVLEKFIQIGLDDELSIKSQEVVMQNCFLMIDQWADIEP